VQLQGAAIIRVQVDNLQSIFTVTMSDCRCSQWPSVSIFGLLCFVPQTEEHQRASLGCSQDRRWQDRNQDQDGSSQDQDQDHIKLVLRPTPRSRGLPPWSQHKQEQYPFLKNDMQ